MFKRFFSKKQINRSVDSILALRHWLRRLPFAQLDYARIIPGKGVLIRGILIDPGSEVLRVQLLFKDGRLPPVDLQLTKFRDDQRCTRVIPLRDSEKPGFASLVTLPDLADFEQSPAHTQVGICFTLKDGRRITKYFRKPGIPLSVNLNGVRDILASVPYKTSDKHELFDNVYGPAVGHVWSHRPQTTVDEELKDYNTHLAPLNPVVSLVIPIYGRHDFIEYQLSSFSSDADMLNHEIIFVIDDPRLINTVNQTAEWLQKIYPLAFRILYLKQNRGYAGANNAGVRQARASAILLLNSDVLPSRTAWLKDFVASAGDDINSALFGARLLYEDNSVQHDGMEFFASPFVDNLWTNIHPGKGLPADIFPQSKIPVNRQTVTGACLLVSKSNYELIGGLNECYILGDFEDSDFCLKARKHGLDIKLAQNIVLYHLERQSQSLVSKNRWKQEVTYYNCWQHSQIWDKAIRQLNSSLANA
ncbi:glycosyltransferase family 2 protein [bacterium]|nr:glycosyltransferase family 2 protein [bacterium]